MMSNKEDIRLATEACAATTEQVLADHAKLLAANDQLKEDCERVIIDNGQLSSFTQGIIDDSEELLHATYQLLSTNAHLTGKSEGIIVKNETLISRSTALLLRGEVLVNERANLATRTAALKLAHEQLATKKTVVNLIAHEPAASCSDEVQELTEVSDELTTSMEGLKAKTKAIKTGNYTKLELTSKVINDAPSLAKAYKHLVDLHTFATAGNAKLVQSNLDLAIYCDNAVRQIESLLKDRNELAREVKELTEITQLYLDQDEGVQTNDSAR